MLDLHGADLAALPELRWLGYLSTTAIYGDRGGAAVDEATPPAPANERGRRRLAAEAGWQTLARRSALPLHIFRLAGIYGPGRSALDAVREGRAQRIDLPGHVFSRIHVADLAAVLRASLATPNPGAIYTVADDEPAPQADVVAFACRLLHRAVPRAVPLAEAGPLAAGAQLLRRQQARREPPHQGRARRAPTLSDLSRGACRHPQPPAGLSRSVGTDAAQDSAMHLLASGALCEPRAARASSDTHPRDSRWSPSLTRITCTSRAAIFAARSRLVRNGTSSSSMPCNSRTGQAMRGFRPAKCCVLPSSMRARVMR